MDVKTSLQVSFQWPYLIFNNLYLINVRTYNSNHIIHISFLNKLIHLQAEEETPAGIISVLTYCTK